MLQVANTPRPLSNKSPPQQHNVANPTSWSCIRRSSPAPQLGHCACCRLGEPASHQVMLETRTSPAALPAPPCLPGANGHPRARARPCLCSSRSCSPASKESSSPAALQYPWRRSCRGTCGEPCWAEVHAVHARSWRPVGLSRRALECDAFRRPASCCTAALRRPPGLSFHADACNSRLSEGAGSARWQASSGKHSTRS